jgi:hypothetical protein
MFLFLGLSLNDNIQAQQVIRISEELLTDGERFQIKTKSGIGYRFKFDIYEVTKYKQGPTKTVTKSPLFSNFEEAKSDSKSSFHFVSTQGDSSVVNINKNMVYRGFDNEFYLSLSNNTSSFSWGFGSQEVFESSNNYNALISTTSDSSLWRLILTEKYGTQVEGVKGFSGWLTDGERRVEILPVFDYQKKMSLALELLVGEDVGLKGYEFRENAKAIGAVQLGPFPKKMYAWFAGDLDSNTKFLLAASYSALLAEFMNTTSEF